MRSLLLMLIPAILMAQRSALPPQEAFDRELKKNRLGTWLVLEDEGALWGATMQSALSEEPLVALNLPVKVIGGGKKPDAMAGPLRERYSWGRGAHWALVDASGRILVERAEAPTAAALATAAEQAGIRSRAQELEAFLRQNPDHLDAQLALLLERISVANRRTAKALGPAPKPVEGAPAEDEPKRMLDPESDAKIWSVVAQQLDRLFQGPWLEAGTRLGGAIRISVAEQSPTMVAILTRHRGEIEAALRRRPSSVEVWFAWLNASQACGGWPLQSLLQTLQPLPGTTPAEWPPLMVLTDFVKDAKARRDWASIREVMEARWEEMKNNRSPWSGQGLWNVIISPLVEALVFLGDTAAADQLLSEVAARDTWSGLPGQARDLATRLNRPDLAARWGALTPKGR